MTDEEILANQANLQKIREAELAFKIQYACDVTPRQIKCPECGAHMIFKVESLKEEVDGRILAQMSTVCIKGCSDGVGFLFFPDELAIEELQQGYHRTMEGCLQNEIPEYKWGSD